MASSFSAAEGLQVQLVGSAGWHGASCLSGLRRSSKAKGEMVRFTSTQEAEDELCRPSHPVAEPWPVSDLRAFDAPTEGHCEINYGPLLREVLRARGWRYSTAPCHGVYDEDTDSSTFYVKEFEACLQGKSPCQLFGKSGSLEDGYRLQALRLPRHALWMMGADAFSGSRHCQGSVPLQGRFRSTGCGARSGTAWQAWQLPDCQVSGD